MKSLALGGLDEERRVKRIEQALCEESDTVVYAEDNNEGGSADSDTDERNPGNDVDDRLLLTGEKVSTGDEEGLHNENNNENDNPYCRRRVSIFSI
jgi:hypothetical protein